ncbi:cbb3-type cytochrome oxidase assembly protein CcoS [Frateuria sp. STR12]|uniref:cbb3-type cytochrome oxidase assembly protein CcoS n=1 Tax=Frateuria hangzhouensis TaxID=2995589 RepID=UPI002260F684|nr:cbb3-type cytochrome oxidase assembly protein CcoS [Frateuria sp. STR12]MCX7515032.1 cbb3-type cytochrome oxidase assembly protein CcoS [Frateuria sp. STR12]
MNILLVLIPVTGVIVLVAVALFFWAANHQQFDDLDSPAVLPLMEDEPLDGPAPTGAPAPSPSPESKGESP